MTLLLERIRAAVQSNRERMIDFTQRMVATPSLPGQEGDVAAIVSRELHELGYDEVYVDEVGNVIGKIKGGDGPAVLLNGHMDHVDPGPAEGWPYPPFGGQIVEGELWGRASVDMKGPMACMIYATSLFKQLDLQPKGDIYMTAPVMEEVGGLGTVYLAQYLQAQAAICGEPSNNTLRRGHRGRVELWVTFSGKSAHASVPHLGLNPHFAVARFILALSRLDLGYDPTLGPSTVVPTRLVTDQLSRNVIPARIELTLDWRNVAAESPSDILAKTQTLLANTLTELDVPVEATVEIPNQTWITYTNFSQEMPMIFPSYLLAEDHPLVTASHQALVQALGREVETGVWRFATDGGNLVKAGIPTVGFGPGDDRLAHTNQERISLAQMDEAVVAYVSMTMALAEAASKS